MAISLRGVVSSGLSSASADERRLNGFLDRIDGEAQAFRREGRFDILSNLWTRFRNGEHWMQPGEEPIFLCNILGNLIERKTASLMQTKPDMRVSGRNRELSKTAEALTGVCRALFEKLQFDCRGERAADLAATYGFVGFETAWDPYADYGRGDISISVIDSRNVFVDPHCRDTSEVNDIAQYIRVDRPMPLWRIKRIWPGRGGEVRPDEELSSFREDMKEPSSWFGSSMKRVLRPSYTRNSPYAWARVKRYWVASDQVDKTGRLLFPGGRLIHRAGDIVLDDLANPYWDGQWPVDIWDWRVNGDTYMGRSDVEEMRKLQEAFVRLGHILTKNVFLNGSINIIGDWNALTPEDWKKLDNRAARIIRKAPGRELRFEPPPAYPPQYLELMQMLPRFMETLIGVPEASQGKRQPGVIASSAVEGLQTAAETLVRAVARRLEYVIERIGHKLISRVIQFYTSDRVLQITGAQDTSDDYAFKRDALVNEEGKPLDEIPEEERRRFFSNFGFKVTPLSSMPQNKIQRALLAQELFKIGIVDEEEVLKMAEYPDREEVIKRTSEKKAKGILVPPETGRGRRSNTRGTKLSV